jgi:hypothetical protein
MRCSGFSTDQLQQIVGALPAELPWRRWIALLGLFTGAGLNEICCLATDDAAEQDGVPVLLIRPDTGRGLKTPNARRVISVHPTLIRCGFLAYVAERRAAGESRLFPSTGTAAAGSPIAIRNGSLGSWSGPGRKPPRPATIPSAIRSPMLCAEPGPQARS